MLALGTVPIAATVVTVMVMVTMAALVDVPAHNRSAAAADITDRASMAGQDMPLVLLQIRPAMAFENLDDMAHGAKASS